jgi:HEAT repeat protein
VRSAANLRVAAAAALHRCEHPKAREFLVAQRHDQAEGVRIMVLHALDAMPPAQAAPVLREMIKDPSPRVREEAQRYLARLDATPR